MSEMTPPEKELEEVLALLYDRKAFALEQDIRAELARGTLHEIESQKGKREEARRPYTPQESYQLTVQMILAAIDPALMLHDVRASLSTLSGRNSRVEWHSDFIEGKIGDRPYVEKIDQLVPLSEDDVESLRVTAQKVAEVASFLSKEG
ncbi:MAG: hypothetical protein RW306_16240 [Geobacteraceae bacterium]|nr:hypothetical protein [Geobacteraceae bacterium]